MVEYVLILTVVIVFIFENSSFSFTCVTVNVTFLSLFILWPVYYLTSSNQSDTQI